MSKIDKAIEAVTQVLRDAFTTKQEVVKAVNTEERRALFIAMEPDVYDAHGDITSVSEVEKACNNFNQHCMTANLFHLVETQAAVVQQSFITPAPMTLDNGREISKGTWMMWMQFPEGNAESDVIWDMVKSGEINGISIGARGYKTEITE